MRHLILLFTLFLHFQATAQIDHYETIVYAGDSWSYFSESQQPAEGWNTIDFEETSWQQGLGGFGYGDGDDNTVIEPTTSVFIRNTFELLDTSVIQRMVLSADYDDAFVAYLNGVEIARSNIAGNDIKYNTQPTDLREAVMYSGGAPESYFIDKATLSSLLQEGENVLAIQTLNFDGASSSDMTALYWLTAGMSIEGMQYGEPPSWFSLGGFESNLPIFVINTLGNEIVDEPKVDAMLGIIWDENNGVNNSADLPNHFEGNIAIELRGNSSLAFFPKNNFGFETRAADGSDLEISLLDFPKEEDWILHGPYSDKSLLRNIVMLDIGREIGPYASRSELIEVVLNNEYHGVYVFMEKIKRDNDRVDIKKIEEVDVTGGYIIRVDHGDADWQSTFGIQGNSGQHLGLQYYYPKRDDITQPQKDYIQSYVDSLERALRSTSEMYGGKHYSEYIDLESFADYFILSEFSNNIDAYRLSAYLHKDSDEIDGLMKAGPIWDYNLSLGNSEYCQGSNPNVWEYLGDCSYNNPFWWQKLMSKVEFQNLVKCKWYEQRDETYSVERLHELIDNSTRRMEAAINRNFDRWPVIGQYVWPNAVVFNTYSQEVEFVKSYIEDRWEFINDNLPGVCPSVSTEENIAGNNTIMIYPNPTSAIVNILSRDHMDAVLVIRNLLGEQIFTQHIQGNNWEIDISGIANGAYLIELINPIDNARIGSLEKIIKI